MTRAVIVNPKPGKAMSQETTIHRAKPCSRKYAPPNLLDQIHGANDLSLVTAMEQETRVFFGVKLVTPLKI